MIPGGDRRDGGDLSAARRSELARALAAVRVRIEAGCRVAGRDPAAVTLVVVTKTYPASDIALLTELGVTDVGENREQELRRKVAELAEVPLRWHFVGQLQSNKARSVAAAACLVHTVDRMSLVRELDRAAQAGGRIVDCLVQVNLDGESHRGGVSPQDLPPLADAVASAAGLRLGGVMAVAPRGGDAHAAFTTLAHLHRSLLADHPRAGIVSAGMSGDLEAALACGATHLRVGSAILGMRPRLG